jgi:DNA repair protein RecO (recombination protein O)
MLVKTEGIIIRTNDYGEGNKIVTLYSSQLGKISFMARGARKPKSRLSSICQLFTYGHYLFYKGSSNSMGSLSQGEIIESFKNLRQDLKKTAYSAYFAELVDKLVEDGERNQSLFHMFLTTLRLLDEGKDAEILARLFEMKMCIIGGYRPEVNQCVQCGSIEQIHSFSIKEGGFLCEQCVSVDPNRQHLLSATIKLLRLLYHFDIDRLGNISVKDETKEDLKKILWAFMDHHTPLRLKSRSFLEQMSDYFT